jgi:serpin B
MNTRLLLAASLIASATFACAEDDTTPAPDNTQTHTTVRSPLARETTPDVDPALLDTLAAGNQDLTFDLYRQTAEDGQNYFMSAVSIQQAFALVYAGARGQTATEMATVLHFDGEPADFHAAMNAFDLALTSRNLPATGEGEDALAPVQLSVANAFWGQDGYPWLEPYLDILALNYGAGIEALDFNTQPEESRLTINEWVENRTQDRIRDLLPEGSINPNTAAVLTNAIYFKAPWASPFTDVSTSDGPFTLADGSTVTTPLMRQTESHLWAETTTWQAVEMSFRGDELAMLVIVPNPGSFAAVDTALDGDLLRSVTDALQPGVVDFTLPRFTFESEFTLSEALEAMGMTTAFSDLCDLSGMLEGGGLFIDEAYHKAFIAVDETGAEAAAATAVVVGRTSAPVADVTIRADRPFFFAIRDRQTGLLLFWGRVMNPAA